MDILESNKQYIWEKLEELRQSYINDLYSDLALDRIEHIQDLVTQLDNEYDLLNDVIKGK